MTLNPWSRKEISRADDLLHNAIDEDEDATYRVFWRESGTTAWMQSVVLPQRSRSGALRLRIISGADSGQTVDFPLRGIEYGKVEPAGQQRFVNAMSRHQEQINERTAQLEEDRRALSSQRRSVLTEQNNDWNEIQQHRVEAQTEVDDIRDQFRQEQARLEGQRNHLENAMREATARQRAGEQQLADQRATLDDQAEALHNRLAEADQDLRAQLLAQQNDIMLQQRKVAAEAKALRLEKATN